MTNCNFKNSDIRWCSFTNAIVKNTDFRGSNFEFKQFSKQQQEEAIFTDSQYEQYISKLESKNILQEKTLENINEEKTEKLVSGFEKLQKEFAKEERLWLVLSYMSFFTIF